MLHFRVPHAFHQRLHFAQRLQPGETAEPLIQVGQGRALGRLLDAVERSEAFCAFSRNESQQGLLLCFGEPVSHALVDAPVYQVPDAPGHALQRTEAWQLAVLFHQDFNRRADQDPPNFPSPEPPGAWPARRYAGRASLHSGSPGAPGCSRDSGRACDWMQYRAPGLMGIA